MKCPQCGDDMVDGRCAFCGYRPTEADRKAYARWAEQKKQAERGFSGPDPPAKGNAAPSPKAGTEPAPRRERKAAPKAAARPPERRERRRKPARARDGPGLFGRIVPRLVALAWAALLVYLMVSELAAGMPP